MTKATGPDKKVRACLFGRERRKGGKMMLWSVPGPGISPVRETVEFEVRGEGVPQP